MKWRWWLQAFFILFCPLRRLTEVYWRYLDSKVKMCVHFMLNIRGVRFIVCWAYAEWGLSNAQHTRGEVYRMLSIRRVGLHVHLVFFVQVYTEHTQSEVYCMLSIHGVRFIICWAYAEWGLSYAEHTQILKKHEYLGQFKSNPNFVRV